MNNNYIEQKKNTHIYFQVGNNKYAINTDNVLEIIKLPALDYPQKLPHNIIGLLKYNNFVINIIDLRFYLDIEVTPYNTNNELLIVKTDEAIFGIITDHIIGILPFDTALTDQIPYVNESTVIDALYKLNEDTIFIVNVYAIENILKTKDQTLTPINVRDLFPKDTTSCELMENRTRTLMTKSAVKITTDDLYTKSRYISFNLGNDFYCIPLNYVREVLKDTVITPIPGIPSYIKGIINLRGDYISVIDLKEFLSLPSIEKQSKNPVIVVKCNDLQLAFLIDQINELFDFQENIAENNLESYYLNEFIYNETLYTILNVDKITSDKKIIISDI